MQQNIISFFRRAFLRHGPRRFAVMQPETADRKYNDHPGQLTDQQIVAHLEGRAAYAVPYIEAGLGHLLAFDVDAGGIPAIAALLEEAERRGLWAFAQHDPGTGRGYVWLPFADLAAAPRLHALGEQILASVQRPGWRIENRATEADTRLPFARHRWTGRRGLLEYQNGQLADLDAGDLAAILERFASAYRENDPGQLPPPPEAAPATTRSGQDRPAGPGTTIAAYNARTDLAALLESYGAKKARGQGARLYFCPFHGDNRASLLLTRDGDRCHCLSQGSDCPLSGRQHDAFNVFCAGERITPAQAIRRLNGLPDDPDPRKGGGSAPSGHKTPPAPPRETREARSTRPTRQAANIAALEAPRTPTPCPDLPKAARRVLDVIRQHPGGYIRGKYHLARLLDIDPRTVQRSLRRLEALGLIDRRERGREGQTDIYRPAQNTGEGRHLPPTLEQEISTTRETLEAGKGGQRDQATGDQVDDQATGYSQADGLALPDPNSEGAYQGPGGAIVYPGGAAWVPPMALEWYKALEPQLSCNTVTQYCVTTNAIPPEIPAQAAPEPEPEQMALDNTPPPRPRRRRQKRQGFIQPGQLVSRIIAATRKAEKLERGTATEKRQAKAIRRSIEDLERQLARVRAEQEATGYSAEECEQWLAAHAQGVPDQGQPPAERTPPLTSSLPDASGLIARLRHRLQTTPPPILHGNGALSP